MYLTVHAVLNLPTADDVGWVDDVLTALDRDKMSVGALVARTDDEPRGHAVMIWSGQDDVHLPPTSAVTGTAGATGTAAGQVRIGAGTGYRALNTARVPDSGTPRFVQLTHFAGPRSQEWVAAFERGGRERIWPAVRTVPGGVSAVSGVQDDGGALTVSLAESRESLGEAVRRIMSTQLLPGERPELLTGPDRVEIQRVLHAVLPETGWSLT